MVFGEDLIVDLISEQVIVVGGLLRHATLGAEERIGGVACGFEGC